MNSPTTFPLLATVRPSLLTSKVFFGRLGRVRVSVLVEVTVVALETPVVAAERCNVTVVVGLLDESSALMVGAWVAEVPAMAMLACGVLMVETPVTVL